MRLFSRDDAAANARSRLPDDEQVKIPVIWLTEIFTPTTINALVDGMRELGDKVKDPVGFDVDLGEWIQSSRSPSGTGNGAHNLPPVMPRGSLLRLCPRFEDQVPAGISHVELWAEALTPSVTALTAGFYLKDDRARELEGILKQDFTTYAEKQPRGNLAFLSPEAQKVRAVDEWRATLHHEAAAWLAQRFPGAFHNLAPGQLPAIEVLLTGRYRPWKPSTDSSCIPEWIRILEFSTSSEYWQCNRLSYLYLKAPSASGIRHESRHTLVLTASEEEMEKDPLSVRFESEIISPIPGVPIALLPRWSLSAFLWKLEDQISVIQTTANRASQKRSAKALSEIQRQLLRTGIDGGIVADDIVRYTGKTTWGRGLLDFSLITPCPLTRNRQSPVSLSDTLRQLQVIDGKRVINMGNDLRDTLSANAELAAATANLRLQRAAVWIAITSMIIAAVAAVATIIAVWNG